jgi:predicted P-loop ATPase
MRKLLVTWWNQGRNGENTPPGVQKEFGWSELVEWIEAKGRGREHLRERGPRGEVVDSLRHPCWSPAEYRGRKRSLATFERGHVVGLDYDDLTPEQHTAIAARLSDMRFAYLLYSTKSCTSEVPAFRVLFPLAEPLDVHAFRRLRSWLNELIGGAADKNAADPSRFWWEPTKPHLCAFWSTSSLGARWVSGADVPEGWEPPKPEPTPKQQAEQARLAELREQRGLAPRAAAPRDANRQEPSPAGGQGPQKEDFELTPEQSEAKHARLVRRANKFLTVQCAAVGLAPQGTREETLRKAAALIAGKTELANVLGRTAVIEGLVRAAVHAGLPESEAREKAERAYEWGNARPLPLTGSEQAEKDDIRLRDRDESGKPKATLQNTLAVLEHPKYSRLFVYDQFEQGVRLTRPVPGTTERADTRLVDVDITAMRRYLSKAYGFEPSKDHMWDGVELVARECAIHPVREWLSGLKWDGVHRLDTLLSDCMGCEEGEVVNTRLRLAQAARIMCLSAVARVMEPGCKADIAVVFHGRQARLKSSSFAALVGKAWFSDAAIDLHSKDAPMTMQGKWLVELPELSATRARDVETVKAFMSRADDRYRPPYGRAVVNQPRQSIFVGTSNDMRPFTDKTGNRRFFSVLSTHRADLELLRGIRSQVWAEAFNRHQLGEPWWLSGEEEDDAAEVQDRFSAATGDEAWEQAIAEYLANPKVTAVTTKQIAMVALGIELARVSRSEEMRIAAIMARHFADWPRARVRVQGVPQNVYKRAAG